MKHFVYNLSNKQSIFCKSTANVCVKISLFCLMNYDDGGDDDDDDDDDYVNDNDDNLII